MSSNRVVPWYVPHLLFVLAGVLIFVIAFNMAADSEHGQMWADIIKDFGVVIMALAVTDIVWKIVGGDPVTGELTQLRGELSQQVNQLSAATELVRSDLFQQVDQLKRATDLSRSADDAGLVFMSFTPFMNVNWKLMFMGSESNIDLTALTLLEIVDNQELLAALEGAVKRGVSVRILLYDPKSNSMELIANDKAPTNSLIEMALKRLGEMGRRAQAQKDVKATFRIRLLRDRVLQVAIRRFDDRIFVMHYLQSQTSPKTPAYAIEGADKPLFQIYSEEFDLLFNHSADHDWSVAPIN